MPPKASRGVLASLRENPEFAHLADSGAALRVAVSDGNFAHFSRPDSVKYAFRRRMVRANASVSTKLTCAKCCRSALSLRPPPRTTIANGRPTRSASAQSWTTCQSMRSPRPQPVANSNARSLDLRSVGDQLAPAEIVVLSAAVHMERRRQPRRGHLGPGPIRFIA
jgi:hypothetical protein